MKNLKVIITVGLPASGKTTWANNFISKNEDYVRVNRDELRLTLKNQNVCDIKIENLITEIQDSIILNSLNKKLNVIVDNTNLKEKRIVHILDLVKYKADVEFMVFDVPVKKCIEQDKLRGSKVGEAKIKSMNDQFTLLKDSFVFQNRKKQQEQRHLELLDRDSKLEDCVIVDFDNTLSFISNRSPYEWSKCINDFPNQVVIDHVKMYKSKGYKIIIVSGRDEVCRDESEYWLKHYAVPYDNFFMRKQDDYRKDNVVKEEIYRNLIENKYNVFVVLDDRRQVVKMWRDLGLSVFQVNESFD